MSDDRFLAILLRLEAGQAKLEDSQMTLRTDMIARFDRLQNALEAMRDDITVDFGHAYRVKRIAISASSEVRALGNEVAAMERQIQHLRRDVDELKKGV